MRRAALTLALVLSVGIGTAGCGSGTPSSPPSTSPAAEEPSETPTPTPTPTPTEQAEPEPDRIVVTADAILVLAADGTELAAYDYFQDTAELVAGFTEVFGGPPAENPFEGDTHSPSGIEQAWDGFSILDDDREPEPPHTPNHLIDVTVAEVNGIRVETTDGFTVGTPADEVLSASDAQPYPDAGIIHVDSVPIDFDDPTCPESGCTWSVRFFTDDSGVDTVRMLAPGPNFGP